MSLGRLILALAISSSFIACSPTSPKLLPQPDYSKPVKKQEGGEYVPFDPSVDILFVIDNSGSMSEHQTNLATNIGLFIDELSTNTFLDYRVGVVNSTIDTWGGHAPGELQGTPKVVDKTTPNLRNALATNLTVGINGSGTEVFIETVQRALEPTMLTGKNQGFYRPNALLAIMFITDSDDQGKVTPQQLQTFLYGLKGGDPSKIAVYGAIIPPGETRCDNWGEPTPVKLQDFMRIMSGVELNLCDTDFGQKLAAIGTDILSKVETKIPLKSIPVASTIRLTYGSQVIPNDINKGWIYDPKRNWIILGKDLELQPEPKGTQIEVYFVPADL